MLKGCQINGISQKSSIDNNKKMTPVRIKGLIKKYFKAVLSMLKEYYAD